MSNFEAESDLLRLEELYPDKKDLITAERQRIADKRAQGNQVTKNVYSKMFKWFLLKIFPQLQLISHFYLAIFCLSHISKNDVSYEF